MEVAISQGSVGSPGPWRSCSVVSLAKSHEYCWYVQFKGDAVLPAVVIEKDVQVCFQVQF